MWSDWCAMSRENDSSMICIYLCMYAMHHCLMFAGSTYATTGKAAQDSALPPKLYVQSLPRQLSRTHDGKLLHFPQLMVGM